jgi:hypothetical protein
VCGIVRRVGVWDKDGSIHVSGWVERSVAARTEALQRGDAIGGMAHPPRAAGGRRRLPCLPGWWSLPWPACH